MRLYPRPYEGLHPALPPPENEASIISPGSPITFFSSMAGLLGALPLAAGAILRRPSLRAFGLETNAYGFLGLAALGYFTRRQSDLANCTFLQLQGLDTPTEAKPVDRVGKIEFDDLFCLGAISGIVAASTVRKPWAISGWKRWLGAAAGGTTVATFPAILGSAVEAVFNKAKLEEHQKHVNEKAGWGLVIQKTSLMVAEQRLRLAGVQIPQVSGMPQEMNSPGSVDMQTIPLEKTGRYKTGFDAFTWGDGSNEPHLMQPAPGNENETFPSANTNYAWTGTVQQLEQHIVDLQVRREHSAREAELLWYWLARKERDFRNTSSGPGLESDERVALRRYVETVGNVHTKVWTDVSHYDWMIADARKRIAQLQSTEQTADGTVTWGPALSIAASGARSDLSTQFFKAYLKQIEARKVLLETSKNRLEHDLKQIASMPDQAKQPMHKAAMELSKRVHNDLDAARLDAEVLQKVVADAERLPEIS